MTKFNELRADELHEQGMALSDAGDEESAIRAYSQALALDPHRAATLYNLGLVYKYRLAWRESFDCNARSRMLQSDDEATQWNLAIAATALRDWSTARDVWQTVGVTIKPGEGPVEFNGGSTPVRLNWAAADGAAIEVVWAKRLCPARARLLNIPTGATGFRYGDIVLNDGAPAGYRLDSDNQERAVFNVLELFEPSPFSTYEAHVQAGSQSDMDALASLCDAGEFAVEDWTAALRVLCRACSEGRPHENHDHDLPEDPGWAVMRRLGFGVIDSGQLQRILDTWCQRPGCRVDSLECTLEAPGE